MPIGNLKIDPERIGIPRSQPTSTTLQLNIPLSTKKVTNTTLSVQQAKQMVNAKVFRKRILCDCAKLFIKASLLTEKISIFRINKKDSYNSLI